MENTQICEQIIKDFNGEKISGKISCISCVSTWSSVMWPTCVNL